MRVHTHTKLCFLCVLTFLFHHGSHCHGDGHHHHGHHHHGDTSEHNDHKGHGHAHSDLQLTPAPKPPPAGSTLEEEQHFYIAQLFRRYGQQDRLDFGGFQSLLLSLGLGEVKLVGLEHEELGHDHVAHLDLLEVQEGLHHHTPTHESHHGHGRANKHPHFTEQRPTHSSSPSCHPPPGQLHPTAHRGHSHNLHTGEDTHQHDHDQNTGQVRDRDPTHDHDHDHNHDHDHDHTQDPDHDHDHDHTQDHDHDHDHTQDHDHDHDHTQDNDHNHEHEQAKEHKTDMDKVFLNQEELSSKTLPQEHHAPQPPPHAQGGADPPSSLPEQPAASSEPPQPGPVPTSTAPLTPRPRRNRKPGRGNRNQQRTSTTSPLTTTPEQNNHSGHDHHHGHQHHGHQHHGHEHSHSNKKKREAPGEAPIPTRTAPPEHPAGLSHQHEECLNLTQLLSYYGLSSESLISPAQFTYLCPALLYQIDSRVCIRHYHQVEVEHAALEPAHSVWIWVWGFVSISIISLLSLLGVVLVPILNQACFKFLLTFLVALAVGTLSGDALLHLLPHSQGQHDHSHSGEQSQAKQQDLLTAFDGVWKGLTALGGIYLLFIIEHCLGMFQHYRDQGGSLCGGKKKGEEAKIGRKLSDHKLNRRSDAEWVHLKPLTEVPDPLALPCDNGHNDTQVSELQPLDSPSNKLPAADPPHQQADSPTPENGRHAKKHGHSHSHSHGHSHGGNCHSDQEMKDAGIASIAWMVIMGDGMHNFSDGLAIGAAFSANITGGISTSVAVFCHELPHELGDFAVLLKAGMSVKQAIVYNLLSALMAYVGMIIGMAVGQYTHNVTSWIFAVTAGMFLYVALVDMLPEMLHGDSEDHKRCQLGHFVLQNCGMLTGFAIMLLIAIFEDQIVLDFGFNFEGGG